MVSPEVFAIVSDVIGFLFNWWVWGPVVLILGFLTWQNSRRTQNVQQSESVLLLLEIPRANEKKELAAEQMFASLHGILRSRKELIKEGILQEHISFEIASIGQQIRFYVWLPKHLQNFVEGQIYAQYPTVQIYEQAEDYANRELPQPVVHAAELTLSDNEVLPIKTFPNFEVDPLAAVTATLAKLDQDGEELWVQILARPIEDNWHKKSQKYVDKLKNGGGLLSNDGTFIGYIRQIFSALLKPPEVTTAGAKPDLSERDKSRVTAIEEKSRKLGYSVKMRIVYAGPDKTTARLRMQAIVGTFKQFNSTNLNGFEQTNTSFSASALGEYRARYFYKDGQILNIEELASVYHLPHTNVETPNIVWSTARTAEPPSSLPAVGVVHEGELSPFGTTNFRGTNTQFGIKRNDRSRHLYIIGQTGVGKSGLLELLTLSDVFHNYGFAVIDPHGDYAQSIMSYVPAHRIQDVVYFNPADNQFPIGFNPMEVTDPSLKNHISSELVGVMKRMFDSWGPRLEYILRYTLLALLDYPNSTMLDITRMLTEKNFRDDVIKHIDDPVVRNFWTTEFASWNDKFASEAVAPVLNKVGAFTANPMIRNIIGQPKSTFNIRQIMDEGKILIVNLSRGLVGEDNAGILGALMVTKIQLAAMSRADIMNLRDRRPFYLYVDEFQNFATDSFAVILSEARKYGLNLTVANQYVSQMTPEVRDAVFGNVGSFVSFRVGADDATALQRYFEPQFDSQDLIQLHNRHFVAALSIDGEKSLPFSATTLNIPVSQADHTANIVQWSRQSYARPKTEVEALIAVATTPKPQPQHGRPTPKHNRQKPQSNHQKTTSKPASTKPEKKNEKNPRNKPQDNKQNKRSNREKGSDKRLRNNKKVPASRPTKPVKQPQKQHGTIDEDSVIDLR